jgi:hypothetical protein
MTRKMNKKEKATLTELVMDRMTAQFKEAAFRVGLPMTPRVLAMIAEELQEAYKLNQPITADLAANRVALAIEKTNKEFARRFKAVPGKPRVYVTRAKKKIAKRIAKKASR